MTKGFQRISSAILVSVLAFSLSACAPKKSTAPTHKAATSACLVRAKSSALGSADSQLAADLVEAQVIYGIKVREVLISNDSNLGSSLLRELQSGCVLMVSSNTRYLTSLAQFAKAHTKTMVLFVGGKLTEAEQPSNFRWIQDQPNLSAELAGYAAAERGQDIHILYSSNFQSFPAFQKAFEIGVRAQGNQSIQVTSQKVSSLADFKAQVAKLEMPSTLVALVHSGYLTADIDFSSLDVLGMDLQLGQTSAKLPKQVFASIERNTSDYVLKAVASLLSREVTSDPKYRVLAAINELRTKATKSDGLLAFEQETLNITP